MAEQPITGSSVPESGQNFRNGSGQIFWNPQRQYNSGIVEALNGVAKLRFRKAFGFRTFEAIEVALYHQLGHLPEPELAHSFR